MLRRTARFLGGVCGISHRMRSASIRSTFTPGVQIDRHVFQREASPPGDRMSIASWVRSRAHLACGGEKPPGRKGEPPQSATELPPRCAWTAKQTVFPGHIE
jgi:hypothetical protein